jgi:hypothetical protein
MGTISSSTRPRAIELEIAASSVVGLKDLVTARWCEANGHRLALTSTAFGRALRDLIIVGQKSGGVMRSLFYS